MTFFEYLFYMKKFVITEEEKKHIMSLYETIGEKLSPESLSSPKSQGTKRRASFLNSYYKTNLNAATTGSWTDKDYNETLKKFMEEKGITVWICKKGDGWCSDEGHDEGEVTTKELDKLEQAMNPNVDKPKNVKLFQDWLDKYYPNWIKGGKLNKGRGYGKFGPYTKAAWTKYKSQYKEV